jgi:hypothetical protein
MMTLLLVALLSGSGRQTAASGEVPRSAKLRTLGNVQYLMLDAGAPQDRDVRELVVRALRESYMKIGVIPSLDALNEEQQGQAARCLLSEQRGNRLTLECRDIAGRHVGTLVSDPAPLNRAVSTTVWRLLNQLQELRFESGPAARPLTTIKYLNVLPWHGGLADREYFIAELRRSTPFTIVDDIAATGVDAAEIVNVTLHDPGVSSGPLLAPSVAVHLLLSDSAGVGMARIGAFYGEGLSFSIRSYSHRRIHAAVKALRQAYERDKRIYTPVGDK